MLRNCVLELHGPPRRRYAVSLFLDDTSPHTAINVLPGVSSTFLLPSCRISKTRVQMGLGEGGIQSKEG
jgi:hypothetical protein